MPNSAIILCGGKATRMGDLCVSTPKILMEVKGETILEHQIEMLRKADVQKVVLAVGHLKETLRSEVGDTCRGVDIVYSEEDEPLGTGGAFKNAFKHVDGDCFGLNGDIFMPGFNPSLLEKTNLPQADIVVTTMTYTPPYGMVVPLDGVDYGLVDRFEEKKPVMCNAGVYLIKESAKKLFPNKGSIEYDVFESMHVRCGYLKYNGKWFDLGTPEDLNRANQ